MTIALRQEWPTAWTAATATTVVSGTPGSACLVGSGIGCWVLFDGGAGSTLPSSVVDSASQSYTYTGTVVTDNNSGLNWALYRLNNNASATSLILTATWAAAIGYRGLWPFEISGTSGYQTSTGNDQSPPAGGGGVGAITSGATGTLIQPCLAHVVSVDSQANGLSTVVSPLVTGVGSPGLLLSGNSFSSGVSGSVRLTSTSPFTGALTNATDGPTASFLTGVSVWTEQASGNTASIAWVG